MSNTFTTSRFFSLIARQWINFGKIYIMALGIAAGVIAAFYGWALYEYNGIRAWSNYVPPELLDFRVLLFIFLGMFFVTIISGTYFSDYGQKPKAIFEMLIPASRLEKFLTAIFYTVILCIVSYVAVFLLIDFSFVSYFRSQTSVDMTYEIQGHSFTQDRLRYFVDYDVPHNGRYFYFLPFLFNAIFLLGSIAYRNFQYIKTALTLIVYGVVYCIGMVYILKALTEGTVQVNRYSSSHEIEILLQIISLIGVLVTLCLWGIGFLRLKEKEV